MANRNGKVAGELKGAEPTPRLRKEDGDVQRQGREGMDCEAYVRRHPIRAKILALHEEDEGRSFAAVALLRDLGSTQATAAIVDYHVRVLKDVSLLPGAGG